MPDGPVSFRVAVTEGDVGSPDVRLPFSLAGTTFVLDIEAVPAAAFRDGWVAVRSQPGDVVAVCPDDACSSHPGFVRTNVRLSDGRATGVRVTIAKAYGDARIWVEDLGFVPGTALGSACGNGLDDDDDGRVDYGEDPGCAFSNDDTETGGSHAVGLSPALYYANPRIADVQGMASESPLLGRSVTIDGGEMVVVRVSVDGLYVTDVGETRGYDSLFAYNFNTPQGVRVCDRLIALAGIVGEFYGYTELGFPSWTRDPAWPRPLLPSGPGECPVPEPTELTVAVLDDAAAMESLECGLAQVTGGTITPRFHDCDARANGGNGNGAIDFGTVEETCADTCDDELDCTEASQYRRYGQFGIATAGATPAERRKVLVLARDSMPDFDARDHAGETAAVVRGTMKQVEFLNIPWILEVRCRDDLVFTGDVRPMWEACVTPPDDGEGYAR